MPIPDTTICDDRARPVARPPSPGSAVAQPLRRSAGLTPSCACRSALPLNVLEPCNGVQGTAGA
jgi:hypothetical protein